MLLDLMSKWRMVLWEMPNTMTLKFFKTRIIYEIIDLVKDNMAELLEPELVEKKAGRAEIRQVFQG